MEPLTPPPVLSSEVELVDPTTLEPHPENPRQGDLGAVVSLVRENGFVGVVYAQRSRRRIIAGHTRTRAAVELAIPAVPVLWLDVDDATALRLVLADNRGSDLATYDDAALADLLQSLHEDDGGLAGTGFDGDDLDDLLASLAEPFRPELQPETSVREYSDADVAKAQDALDGQFKDAGKRDLRTVTCPHCAGEFMVDQ